MNYERRMGSKAYAESQLAVSRLISAWITKRNTVGETSYESIAKELDCSKGHVQHVRSGYAIAGWELSERFATLHYGGSLDALVADALAKFPPDGEPVTASTSSAPRATDTTIDDLDRYQELEHARVLARQLKLDPRAISQVSGEVFSSKNNQIPAEDLVARMQQRSSELRRDELDPARVEDRVVDAVRTAAGKRSIGNWGKKK